MERGVGFVKGVLSFVDRRYGKRRNCFRKLRVKSGIVKKVKKKAERKIFAVN